MNYTSETWNRAAHILAEFKRIAKEGGGESDVRDMLLRELSPNDEKGQDGLTLEWRL